MDYETTKVAIKKLEDVANHANTSIGDVKNTEMILKVSYIFYIVRVGSKPCKFEVNTCYFSLFSSLSPLSPLPFFFFFFFFFTMTDSRPIGWDG